MIFCFVVKKLKSWVKKISLFNLGGGQVPPGQQQPQTNRENAQYGPGPSLRPQSKYIQIQIFFLQMLPKSKSNVFNYDSQQKEVGAKEAVV